MSAIEDAKVLRAAVEVLTRHQKTTGYLGNFANELDPPPPPLPTEYGWHTNVRPVANPSAFAPGAFKLAGDRPRRWVALHHNGDSVTFYDDEVEVVEP